MTTGNPVADLTRAAADITAAYAGNPTPSLKPDELVQLYKDLHAAVTGTSGVAGEVVQQITQAAPAALAAPKATETRRAPAKSSMASLIASSSVNAGLTADTIDPVAVWPNSTDDERAKFVALIKKHNIPLDANGVPRPRRPVDELVQGWEIIDPIDGKGFQMMKRRLRSAYDMDISELRAMFHLPDDFPVTAPLYSESKRRQAAESGLGKGPKGKRGSKAKATEQATPIAEAAPAKKATTAKKAGTRATARAA